jgi:hypothetical protein
MNDNATDLDTPRPRGRKQRRLSDHVIIAVHLACDRGDLEAADRLLDVVEFMLWRPLQEGRRERRIDTQPLVAAHERLWVLRHPDLRKEW